MARQFLLITGSEHELHYVVIHEVWWASLAEDLLEVGACGKQEKKGECTKFGGMFVQKRRLRKKRCEKCRSSAAIPSYHEVATSVCGSD